MDINATLFGQLITFAILVWFTVKYVWPPITKAMHDREKKIASGLEAGERGRRELEIAEQKAISILREAKVEASQAIELAHKRSLQVVEEAKEIAREEGERLLERAQKEIAHEVMQAKSALRKQLANLAVAGAEKILQRNLDASAQTALLNEIVSEI